MTRDRDGAGRPRNARPRDALGRPLARGAPEAGPPEAGPPEAGPAGRARIPDDLVITGTEAAALAGRLLHEGSPFHAHEVLEAAWKSGPPGERDLWQGLAQIAVGLTHARRGNARGAAALLRRGAERVRSGQQRAEDQAGAGRDHPYGMDIPAVLAASDTLAAHIERHGLDGISRADLALRLLG